MGAVGKGAQTLLDLREANPDAYRDRLNAIERGAIGAVEQSSDRQAIPTRRRSLDSLVEAFRKAMDDDKGRSASLSLIRLGVIYACVTLRADMLSGLPLRLYKNTSEGARQYRGRRIAAPSHVRHTDAQSAELVDDHALLKVLRQPNDDWTGRRLLHMIETGLGLMGEAHVRAHRTPKSAPTGLSYYKHGRLRIVKAKDGDPQRTIAGWKLDDNEETLTPDEVLWLRYPDPEDPDYGALPPAAIARLGADSYRDAMAANQDIFKRGLRADAIITPGDEFAGQFSFENIGELQALVEDALKGRENNHGISPLPFPFNVASLAGISPKDAEFVALMDFAIEDVARAYRIPIEMVGGTRRTYQNNEAADQALWQRSLMPEAQWLAEEFTLKLAPMFGLDPHEHFLAFDLSEVPALQDDEIAQWGREEGQIVAGVLTKNEWRAENGYEELEATASTGIDPSKVTAVLTGLSLVGAGQIQPAALEAVLIEAIGLSPQAASAIVDGAKPAELPVVEDIDEPVEDERSRSEDDEWSYGGDAHRAAVDAQDKALEPHEQRIEEEMKRLFARQRESIIDRLENARSAQRIGLGDLAAIFQRGRWVREFRTRMFPLLRKTAEDGGGAAWQDVGADGAFNPDDPPAVNAMRRQAQRFAVEVNETTWQRLRNELADGIKAGESTPSMAERVENVMGDRIRSSAEVIARTEAHTAISTGALEAVKASGVERHKRWLSALDSRTRDDHRDAHGQTVPLDEDFTVGGSTGPAPGRMGSAAQDIQCRCTMAFVRPERALIAAGGQHVSTHS